MCVHSNDGNRVCGGAGVDDHFYSLRRDIAVKAARRKRKEGAGLSLHDRRAQGLELTHTEEPALDEASQHAVCVHASDGNRVCVREGVDCHMCSLDACCIMHSSIMVCDRYDAHSRALRQRIKSANTEKNLLSIANNTEIADEFCIRDTEGIEPAREQAPNLIQSTTLTTRPTVYIRLVPNVPITSGLMKFGLTG